MKCVQRLVDSYYMKLKNRTTILAVSRGRLGALLPGWDPKQYGISKLMLQYSTWGIPTKSQDADLAPNLSTEHAQLSSLIRNSFPPLIREQWRIFCQIVQFQATKI